MKQGIAWLLLVGMLAATPAGAVCEGDCNADGHTTVDELIRGVNIALGKADPKTCPAFDVNGDGAVRINELVAAVNRALNGCPRCLSFNRSRNAYFGDLHVHTAFSWDAYGFDVRTTPGDAYRFARGEPVDLPPRDADGHGTQTLQLDRPLDFAAVTDHAEFLGEVEACTTPDSPAYNAQSCRDFRAGGTKGISEFGTWLSRISPPRIADICGAGGDDCPVLASEVWERIKQATQDAYDRSAQCGFTTFLAYEYSGSPGISTLHRNVIFRGDQSVFPISYFEEPSPHGLWKELKRQCLDAGNGCDVLAIPHNSNESNGNMFFVEYPGAMSIEEEREQAEDRARIEPVVEIFQHKGDSECMNGLAGISGAPDELCNFEKRRTPPFQDCRDGRGGLGIVNMGCVSHNDFVRGALLTGMKEQSRIGANPYRLGIIASTDTHNGTPGAVTESTFIGQRGEEDDTPQKRLGHGMLQPGGIIFNPGGLAGVWAEENSRESIFDALRRREVFGTSGPRITPRLFGAWGFDGDPCTDPDAIAKAYSAGVPMGGILRPRPDAGGGPSFLVAALRDPGIRERPGTPLQRIQIVKGWIENGEAHQQVVDVAGDANNGATVDEQTCTPIGTGFDSLCAVWRDPNFQPEQRAFYYARVVENPTCRWSTYACNLLPPGERPPTCSDPDVPRVIQERAWTSPIWYDPPA